MKSNPVDQDNTEFDAFKVEIAKLIRVGKERQKLNRLLFAGLVILGLVSTLLSVVSTPAFQAEIPIAAIIPNFLLNFGTEMLGAAALFLVIEMYWHKRQGQLEKSEAASQKFLLDYIDKQQAEIQQLLDSVADAETMDGRQPEGEPSQ